MPKFLHNSDFGGYELLNPRLQHLAADPGSGNVSGRLYYHSGNNRPMWHDGTQYHAIHPSSQAATANLVARRDGDGRLAGDILGNAATATKWITARTITLGTDLTGNTSIDGSANVTLNATIANGAVTLAKMANIATARLLGRVSAGSGVVEELTAAQVKTLLAIGIADVSSLQTALDGKASVSHTHAAGDVVSGVFDAARIPTLYVLKTGDTMTGTLQGTDITLTGTLSAGFAGAVGGIAGFGGSGSGTTSQPRRLFSGANNTSGEAGTDASWSLVQGLVAGTGPFEGGAGAILGPFAANMLACWERRGGVVSIDADGTTIADEGWVVPSGCYNLPPGEWKMGRRLHTQIANGLGEPRSPSYTFTDPLETYSFSSSIITGKTTYHALSPYIVFRTAAFPTNVKVEIRAGATLGGSSWETIFDASPTVSKGIWRGPLYRFSSGSHAVFGVRWTFTIAAGVTVNLMEIGLASNMAVQGAHIYASPWRENSFTEPQRFPGGIAGNLTIEGNLTVNGTTTTVNSTTVTIDDPIFTLGGDTPPGTDDGKDRGIEFRWHNGSTAKVGFFGFDRSTGKFTFIPDGTNTAEVFGGTKGTLDANIEWADVLSKPSPTVTVNLTGDVTGSGNGTLTSLGNATINIATTAGAPTIADNSLSLAKLAQIAGKRVLGNASASTANVAAVKLTHAEDIGGATSVVVTHNLNTRDVLVGLRQTGSPYEVVIADVEITSVNTVTVKFATAPSAGAYRCIVVGF
ncbi:MAG: hypothetical protein KF833_18650 [Verrucomicrobiae bacterium]|nr:hypothetical protein [Verrucomicrobiae bacterium]